MSLGDSSSPGSRFQAIPTLRHLIGPKLGLDAVPRTTMSGFRASLRAASAPSAGMGCQTRRDHMTLDHVQDRSQLRAYLASAHHDEGDLPGHIEPKRWKPAIAHSASAMCPRPAGRPEGSAIDRRARAQVRFPSAS